MITNLNRMGWLFYIQKKNGDMQLFVPDSSLIGSGVLLGRDKSCDLIIEDQYISRKHCRIRYYKGNLQINDLGSTNSVFMDGVQIQKGKHFTWLSNSSLSLGVGIEVNAKRVSFKELPKGTTVINKRPPKLEEQELTSSTEFVEMGKKDYQIPNIPLQDDKKKSSHRHTDKIIVGIIATLVFGILLYVVFINFIQ